MTSPRPMGPRRLLLPLTLVALLAGAVGGLAGGTLVTLTSEDEEAKTPATPTARPEPRAALPGAASVVEVVRQAELAVVTVRSDLPPARDSGGGLVERTNVGSGVIIDEDGFVVTNEHVVRDAARLTVLLSDGEERPASLVGDDRPFTDLAVLRIQPGGLTALSLGNSDDLSLGETVVAIGSALFEFRNSVTVGVVSGLHRSWPREGVVMEDLVQTDAAVNHGNSGGALLNLRGELVGLNTTVVRSTETGEIVEGVAFAISSNTIQPIARAIVERGRYPRPFLGIVHRELTPQVAALNNLPVAEGAVVMELTPDSPAQEAGIRVGDIIVRMGDADVNAETPFINALARLRPGETAPIQIIRDGDEITLDVKVALR